MAITRTAHWATREFHEFLLKRSEMPFAWGSNDCCTFAADAILSFTGTDIADDFRGKYTDMVGAFRTIKDVTGGSTVVDAAAYCAQKHDLQELHSPLFAQRGDLVLVQDANDVVAGVVHLNGRHVVVVGEEGIKVKSIRSITRAWRI